MPCLPSRGSNFQKRGLRKVFSIYQHCVDAIGMEKESFWTSLFLAMQWVQQGARFMAQCTTSGTDWWLIFFNYQSPIKHHETKLKQGDTLGAIWSLDSTALQVVCSFFAFPRFNIYWQRTRQPVKGAGDSWKKKAWLLAIFNPAVLILMTASVFFENDSKTNQLTCWKTNNRLKNWYFRALRVSMISRLREIYIAQFTDRSMTGQSFPCGHLTRASEKLLVV